MSIPPLRSLDLPAEKNAGFQRVSFKTLWASVGGEPTVLTLRPVWRQRTILTFGPVCVATQGFSSIFLKIEKVSDAFQSIKTPSH
jgi:hypothetical protein